MSRSTEDFAATYAKMSDEQFSRILSDEKSLVDAARVALHAEMQKRNFASQSETRDAVVEPVETLWESQEKGVGGWLALWCFSAVVGGPLYFFFHLSAQISQTSLLLGVFGSMSWVGIVAIAVFAFQFVAVIFGIATGACVFTGKPFALRMVRIYFLFWAVVEALSCVLIWLLIQAADAASISDAAVGQATGTAAGYLIRNLIVLAVWFAYFKRSRRVRETFGRNLEIFVSKPRKSNPALEYPKSQPLNEAVGRLLKGLYVLLEFGIGGFVMYEVLAIPIHAAGFIGGFVGLLFFPITAIVAPIYEIVKFGNWWPVLFVYGGGFALWVLRALRGIVNGLG